MTRIGIIGGGAAGIAAAITAARNDREAYVFILEQKEKAGKKLLATGNGRCNLTNAGAPENFFASVMSNPKFLYSAFGACDNQRVIRFFEENGMPVKTERGERVFPVSDHSSDVIATLQKVLREKNVEVRLRTRVQSLLLADGRVSGVLLTDGDRLSADAVILATGGASYPATGATGDGYRIAAEAGHTITDISPSLVPFYAVEDYVRKLQGLSLKNVRVRIRDGKKCLYEGFGEMLFTHFGVSGPLILSASASIRPSLAEKKLSMEIDLKPALSLEQLDARLLREFEGAGKKQFKNVIGSLFPSKLVPVMAEHSLIAPEKRVNEITREERLSFARLIKAFPLTLNGLRGFEEAVITKGGVKVKEVNPSTMESKIVENLYFCGELLDADALTGGYNLQIAWSTGYLAGAGIKNTGKGKL